MNSRMISALSIVAVLALPVSALAQGGPGGPRDPQWQDQQRPPQRQDDRRDDPRQGHAQGRDTGHHQGQGAHRQDGGHHRGVVINDDHRRHAREWFDGHSGWSKPLPPGMHRGPAVGERLPQGYYQRPPMVIVDMLPPPPRGHAYFAVGTDVVLAVIATGIIAQIVLSGP